VFVYLFIYVTGKKVKKKWEHLRDNFRAELNKMNASKSGDPGLSGVKESLSGGGLGCCVFKKVR
jgi:hypothetical protein